MTTRMVEHSAAFAKLLNAAAAEGIKRCTAQYTTLAKQLVGTANSGRRVSAKQLRAQATKQLGKRSAGLVTVKFNQRGQNLKSTQWYDTAIDNNKVKATIYPFASKPGEPPRKRTGLGQRSIQSDFDAAIPAGRVGVLPGAKYMVYLNFGTKLIAARPWILVTLERNKQILGLLLQTGAKSVMP